MKSALFIILLLLSTCAVESYGMIDMPLFKLVEPSLVVPYPKLQLYSNYSVYNESYGRYYKPVFFVLEFAHSIDEKNRVISLLNSTENRKRMPISLLIEVDTGNKPVHIMNWEGELGYCWKPLDCGRWCPQP